MGFVKVLPGTTFSAAGDSGALIYAYGNLVRVPPDTHKPDFFDGNYAMFQSLQCHIVEASMAPYNLKLRFDDWE